MSKEEEQAERAGTVRGWKDGRAAMLEWLEGRPARRGRAHASANGLQHAALLLRSAWKRETEAAEILNEVDMESGIGEMWDAIRRARRTLRPTKPDALDEDADATTSPPD